MEVTKKMIEEVLSEFIKDKGYFFPKHYEWEEDGVKYSAWKIGKNIMTGDGGKRMLDEAIARELKKRTAP